jgi:flap endonuclease-1
MLKFLYVDADYIFVFDGVSNYLKDKTKEERQNKKVVAEKKYQNAIIEDNKEDIYKFSKQFVNLNAKIIDESKELILAMGMGYIDAPSEAEAQISYLTSVNLLDYTVSQDYDCLLFGSPNLIRNLSVSGKKKVHSKNIYVDIFPEIIKSELVFKELNITRNKIIWLSMLIGTDFNKKIDGIGPKTALKLVREYDSFEEIIKYLESKNKKIEFDYKEVQDIFLNPNVNKNPKIIKGIFNRKKIEEIMINKAGFSAERINSSLDKFIKQKDERDKQKNISQWF